MKRTIVMLLSLALLFSMFSGYGESSTWDCSNCGRKGNTGNYCGTCGSPAPWIEGAEKSIAIAGNGSKLEANRFKQIGNTVQFGRYPQTKEGTDLSPIDWRVLTYNARAKKALLISEYILDTKPYHGVNLNTTWKQCSLRKWLNNNFWNDAFNAEEQKAILRTKVDNTSNSRWIPSGGGDTEDQVFLLSYEEAWKYFSANVDRTCQITEYAGAKGMNSPVWWLRSAGSNQTNAAGVDSNGSKIERAVDFRFIGIRPVIWVDLNSDIFE